MRIAILGAGFCGLASAWHLLQQKNTEITLFDPNGIGNGASGVAAGLLHGYAGAHAKRNWCADQGLEATHELLQVAEKAIGSPVSVSNGLLRLATNSDQSNDYEACAKRYSDVSLRTYDECQGVNPGIVCLGGIFIPEATVVDCTGYLQGLWRASEALGAMLETTAISTLEELKDFDKIVVAMGAATTSLKELNHLPLTPVKGQIIDFKWPEALTPLPYPLNSHAYLLMHPQRNTCYAGATYERDFKHAEPDLETALKDILPKTAAFFPSIRDMEIIDCRAAFRASTQDHRPLFMQATENCWVLAGMGSKGLLYHALFAKKLARMLVGEHREFE